MLEWLPTAAILGGTMDKVVGIAAGIGALLFLLFKVIIPGSKMITVVNEDVAPNVKYMPLLAKLEKILDVVEKIASQFRSDSGSTLKDTTNRLEVFAAENREAAAKAATAAEAAANAAVDFARLNREHIQSLESQMGTVKELARDDRKLAREDRDLARDERERTLAIMESALRTEAAGELAKESRERTEASGVRIEDAAAVVAKDLAATQKRADDAVDESPGAAADAASQSPDE